MQKHKHKNLSKIMLFVSLYALAACTKSETQNIDFGSFTASIPSNWRKVDLENVDSGVSGLITNKSDTIKIDYGKFSNPFNEIVEVRSIERKLEYDSVKFRYPPSMVFSENAEIDRAQGLYLKEYYYYEAIDGKRAKLGFPKRVGNGYCLLHISKVDSTGNKLSIYAKNVDAHIEEEILHMFKSIRFEPEE